MIRVSKVSGRRIRLLRERYREEMACQIVHDSWHERGFVESHLIHVDERVIGYGCVGGVGDDPRDIVKEIFLEEAARGSADVIFREFVSATGARRIEAQSNDSLLWKLLTQYADRIEHHTRLFDEARPTDLAPAGAVFRAITRSERKRVFRHVLEPVGDWVVDVDGQVVGTGGLMFHYNPPYADIYMEVAEPWRRRGFGAFLVQQLRHISHGMQKTPAARCAVDNEASRRTLERAGMKQCGWIASGTLAHS